MPGADNSRRDLYAMRRMPGWVVFIVLAACGASGPPTYQLTQSRAAVRAAEELEADDNPKAALHLKLARDMIDRAEWLIREHEHDDAALLLKRAEADANLAIALAKAASEREEAEDAMRKVQRLKRQGQ